MSAYTQEIQAARRVYITMYAAALKQAINSPLITPMVRSEKVHIVTTLVDQVLKVFPDPNYDPLATTRAYSAIVDYLCIRQDAYIEIKE